MNDFFEYKDNIVPNLKAAIETLSVDLPALKQDNYDNRMLHRNLEKLEDYLSTYEFEIGITKTQANNIKEASNNICERLFKGARDLVRDQPRGADGYMTEETLYFADIFNTYAHNIPSILKKVSNPKKVTIDSELAQAFIKTSEALLPLTQLTKDTAAKNGADKGPIPILSQKEIDAKKIETNPELEPEDQKEKREIQESLSRKDVQLGQKVIEEITSKIYDELYESSYNQLRLRADLVLSLAKNGATYREIGQKLEHDGLGSMLKNYLFESSGYNSVPEARPEKDINEKLAKLAKNNTDLIVEGFKARTVEKTALTIRDKDCLKKVSMHSYTVRSGVLETNLKYEFKDESSFWLRSTCEYGVSKNGVFFAKYPFRFTSVTYPNGEQMKFPSYERMRTHFVNPELEGGLDIPSNKSKKHRP